MKIHFVLLLATILYQAQFSFEQISNCISFADFEKRLEMNLCVIGTGYVGLVTGVCFAEVGNHVVCVDIDLNKIKSLSEGQVPIFEPNLEKMLQRNIEQGRISFTNNLSEGVKASQIIFLALPTPPGADGSADLSYVLDAAATLAKSVQEYKIIVNKSTVPVGTAALVKQKIAEVCDIEVDVVSNPEFLREGAAVEDFLKPERVVIGSSSEKARSTMRELYLPFVRQGNPIIFMDEVSSELTKYAANAFLATKISFMNEVANLCERVGADVDMVRLGIGSDNRIGKRFLFSGIGYGGSCFPKDVNALQHTSASFGYDFKILEAVRTVNNLQKHSIINKILSFYDGDVKGKHFAVWGLSFKPNTDDIREAPALYIIEQMLEKGATISVYDPEAMPNTKQKLGDKVEYAKDPYAAIQGANALIICTEWPNFRTPDFHLLKTNLKDQAVFDGRNLYEVDKMKSLGFRYFSIGRV